MKGTRFVRQAAVSTETLQASLPSIPFEDDIDHAAIATECLTHLADLKAEHLLSDCFWKDLICMTGTFRTLHSQQVVVELWNNLACQRSATNFKLVLGSSHIDRMPYGASWIQASFSFETKAVPACMCSGTINMAPGLDGTFKIWSFTTMLEKLSGFGNPDHPPLSAGTGSDWPYRYDTSKQAGHNLDRTRHTQCLVIGAGPAGLCTGARLKSLAVDYLIVDRHNSIGGSWSTRFDRLVMNTNKYISDLPYHPEFSDMPHFPTKDDVAKGYRSFVERWKLRLWLSTAVKRAMWCPSEMRWQVECVRAGETCQLTARHLVMATGSGLDTPNMPILPGRDLFAGTCLHSVDFRNSASFSSKHGVVIGSANTAFEIAQDMVESSLASVTMIQRGHTAVIPIDYVETSIAPLFNAEMPLDTADRLSNCWPYAIGRQLLMNAVRMMQTAEPKRYDGLSAAGFNVLKAPDALKDLTERQGGQYLDRGGTQFIVDGRAKVKSGHEPVAFTKHGIRLASGEEVKADLIVFCTGFRGSMRQSAAEIVGQDVADQMQDFWGVNAEGEVRGQACPIGHPNIWYLGGGTAPARFKSRFLALQIKADLEGIPFQVHEMRVG